MAEAQLDELVTVGAAEQVAERPTGKAGEAGAGKRKRVLRNNEVADPADMAVMYYMACIHSLRGDQSPPVKEILKAGFEKLDGMQPRDAMEELLISQMLVTHSRILWLGHNARSQAHPRWAELMHVAADRAANTFRRQMETLAKYRQPAKRRRGRASFTTIRTAHIHAKQILTQSQGPDLQPDRPESEEEEMGFGGSEKAIAGADSAHEAVAEKHGTKKLPG